MRNNQSCTNVGIANFYGLFCNLAIFPTLPTTITDTQDSISISSGFLLVLLSPISPFSYFSEVLSDLVVSKFGI